MTGLGAKFGRKMEAAIAALLTRPSIEDAARIAGVGEKTIRRWLREYRKARREAVGQTTARLQQATGAAGAIVLKLMTDPNVPASVRLRAAKCVLDRATKSLEPEDMEDRIAELERAAEESKKRN
jgi:transposase-like protein